jgi:hypothetical protein
VSVPDATPLTEAVQAMLEHSTGCPCGVLVAPAAIDPEMPYLVLHPLDPTFHGPEYTAPEADAVFVYQVDSVGALGAWQQTSMVAARARWALLARDAAGAFAVPLVAPGLTVTDRRHDSGGGLSPGERLAQVSERFAIWVTTS